VSTAEETGSVPRGRPPGRPRSAEADSAILYATLDLLVEDGYRALSMESVRQRAGVGKATLYRRYSGKAELVAAAVERLTPNFGAPDDTGSFRGDFEALLELLQATLYVPRLATFMPRLMAEAVDDETLYAIFSARLVEPRREVMRTLLRRAVTRGEVREDVDLETAVDVLVGPLVYRIIISGGHFERLGRQPIGVFDAVVDGLAPRAPTGRPSR